MLFGSRRATALPGLSGMSTPFSRMHCRNLTCAALRELSLVAPVLPSESELEPPHPAATMAKMARTGMRPAAVEIASHQRCWVRTRSPQEASTSWRRHPLRELFAKRPTVAACASW